MNGTDTGVCGEAGVHEKDCVGGPGAAGEAQTCCAGLGDCVDESAIPEDHREDMPKFNCKAGRLCAPAAMTTGKSKKCETVAGFDGACLPKCFAPMLQGTDGLSDDCGAFEICLPCFLGGSLMPGCE